MVEKIHIFIACVLIIFVLSVFTFSCSTRTGLASTPTPAPTDDGGIIKPSEISAWDKLVLAAKKEGRLLIYSSAPGGEVRQALHEGFKEKFGFSLEVVSGKGGELAAKLINERRAGLYLVDIYMGGTTTPITQLKPAGALDPLEPALTLPEVKDTKNWYGEKLSWIDNDHTILGFLGYPSSGLGINTNLVKPEEVKSYRNLLEPKWKGKIIMNDPTVAGTGSKGFGVIGFHIISLDYWRELAKQQPVILRDQRQQVEWIAQGKYSILFSPQPALVTDFMRAGAPVAIHIPEEGTYITGGDGNIAMVNRAPHPAAARVFVNWILSRDGQTAFSQAYGRQSLRLDVTTEGLDPIALRQPGAKYFMGVDNEEFLLKQPENMRVAAEIFAAYLK